MGGHYTLTRVPSAVYPLFAVMGFAVVGASYFVYHKTSGPDCIWARKSNPTPWNTVGQHQTSKLWDSTGKYEKWGRFSSSS
ncbi:NADH-ubiquinone reductase complex 1 MLRQ subunit-domain-containing protein [Phlyctochytrium arcticum]|nr:NADH-ubiquinone reductase complex 1 MLRQ subunit-domain-containing protein [Phlyctochytrium arcticum]